MHGLIQKPRKGRQQRRRHRSARRHFRAGVNAAAVRAFTGARLLRDGRDGINTLTSAALACGSCPQYIEAALALYKSENHTLVNHVLDGRISLLAAAKEVKQLSALVAAYRRASAADRIAFAKAIGPTTLFDNDLVPAM